MNFNLSAYTHLSLSHTWIYELRMSNWKKKPKRDTKKVSAKLIIWMKFTGAFTVKLYELIFEIWWKFWFFKPNQAILCRMTINGKYNFTYWYHSNTRCAKYTYTAISPNCSKFTYPLPQKYCIKNSHKWKTFFHQRVKNKR